jgi:transcriptional regulator with XRE-family HTH domain
MMIGERLRAIREAKKLTQGDIERRSGLFRSHISRVENGLILPSIATLEKIARALDMPLYQVLYEPDPPVAQSLYIPRTNAKLEWGSFGRTGRYFGRLAKVLARLNQRDRSLVMDLLQEMNRREPK